MLIQIYFEFPIFFAIFYQLQLNVIGCLCMRHKLLANSETESLTPK